MVKDNQKKEPEKIPKTKPQLRGAKKAKHEELMRIAGLLALQEYEGFDYEQRLTLFEAFCENRNVSDEKMEELVEETELDREEISAWFVKMKETQPANWDLMKLEADAEFEDLDEQIEKPYKAEFLEREVPRFLAKNAQESEFSYLQLLILFKQFYKNSYASKTTKTALRKQTRIKYEQIDQWFLNARQNPPKTMDYDELKKEANRASTNKQKRSKTIAKEQRLKLIALYKKSYHPSIYHLNKISQDTGLTRKRIQEWFYYSRGKDPEYRRGVENGTIVKTVSKFDQERTKKLFGEENMIILETAFQENPYPNKKMFREVFKNTDGMTMREVKSWFETERRRLRSEGKLTAYARTSPENIAKLQAEFDKNPYPADYEELCKQFDGMTRAQVKKWFRCRRDNGRRAGELINPPNIDVLYFDGNLESDDSEDDDKNDEWGTTATESDSSDEEFSTSDEEDDERFAKVARYFPTSDGQPTSRPTPPGAANNSDQDAPSRRTRRQKPTSSRSKRVYSSDSSDDSDVDEDSEVSDEEEESRSRSRSHDGGADDVTEDPTKVFADWDIATTVKFLETHCGLEIAKKAEKSGINGSNLKMIYDRQPGMAFLNKDRPKIRKMLDLEIRRASKEDVQRRNRR